MIREQRPRELPQHVKTNRAFRAYIDLLDAADWLRGEMSGQLASFDLTMMQFRVMEAIFREGPQYQQLLSRGNFSAASRISRRCWHICRAGEESGATVAGCHRNWRTMWRRESKRVTAKSGRADGYRW